MSWGVEKGNKVRLKISCSEITENLPESINFSSCLIYQAELFEFCHPCLFKLLLSTVIYAEYKKQLCYLFC